MPLRRPRYQSAAPSPRSVLSTQLLSGDIIGGQRPADIRPVSRIAPTARDRGPRTSARASSPAPLSDPHSVPRRSPHPYPRPSRPPVPSPSLPRPPPAPRCVAGKRLDLLSERRLVIGHELRPVARPADLDIQHLPVGEVGMGGLDRSDDVVDGASLERVHGRGPGAVDMAELRVAALMSSMRPSSRRKLSRPS